MEVIVFVGTRKSGSSRDGIKAAKKLGFNTILFTPIERYLTQRDEFPDVDEMIYVKNMSFENLLSKCLTLQESGESIRLCISLVDPYVHLAAKLSEMMGLSHASTEALFTMEDKTRFRKVLAAHPSNPFFMVYTGEQSLEHCFQDCQSHFPLVIKPPVSNGSKDIFFVDSENSFYKGLDFLLKKHNPPILIEEFVDGTQYIVEILVFKGKITIAGVIEQELNDNFVVTGYAFPAVLRPEARGKLEETVESIINHLGLETGTCHLEMRLTNGEWKLIEINPRMSGFAMNQIIQKGCGVDLAKETINLYLGIEPQSDFTCRQYVYAQFLTVGERGELLKVTGKKRASNYPGVKKVFVIPRRGAILNPPSSMGYRYAYVIATSHEASIAKEIAKEASGEMKFHLKPLSAPGKN
ncbi:ATP-grasp domain-containing protein [Bacillus sp. FJAT-27445]|uniref:ATP-grasp domain-containing protein n=1 Tax=Bacillus sp. FJAT-27445 TaxID=1679166 RepID=UPI0007439066|nr:ATP-grasp domain-containing protein [Bacillus sp. FJAT-27445]